MCLSFLFHPVSLGVFFLLLADIYLILYFQPAMLLLVMFNVIPLLSTDTVWNIKSTLLIEAVIVAAHAFVRKTDDLSLDEEMPLATEMSNARPWKEMLWSLNLPSGFDNTVERIKKNLVYFEINYKIILMLVTCLSFLYHPVSLNVAFTLVMDVWLFLYYLRRAPLGLQVLVIILVIISMILVSFTEAAWINIISTMLIEAVVVAAHASFRKTEDLFVDEELPQPAGVLTTSTS